MPYNRLYSLEDVRRILNASEGRRRPMAQGPGPGPVGHAMTQHTLAREEWFGRRDAGGNPIEADSTILVPPQRMTEFVHEALNSVPGQRALVKLNHPGVSSVRIRSILIRQHADFDIFVVYQPEGQLSFDWASVTPGNGIIFEMFVLVYKLPNSPNEEIHVQTAYPKSFARLDGEEVVLRKPLI